MQAKRLTSYTQSIILGSSAGLIIHYRGLAARSAGVHALHYPWKYLPIIKVYVRTVPVWFGEEQGVRARFGQYQ